MGPHVSLSLFLSFAELFALNRERNDDNSLRADSSLPLRSNKTLGALLIALLIELSPAASVVFVVVVFFCCFFFNAVTALVHLETEPQE